MWAWGRGRGRQWEGYRDGSVREGRWRIDIWILDTNENCSQDYLKTNSPIRWLEHDFAVSS